LGKDSEMTDVEPVVTEFSSSGRTGRRNALPDIRESSDNPESPLELPQKLENLNLSQSNAENTVAGNSKPLDQWFSKSGPEHPGNL
uniref:cAMP-dependent protein kinase inhibitor beta n=1 Tax=Sarcophilus harrisii TaxID=9305 RepID=G3VED5_SARHA